MLRHLHLGERPLRLLLSLIERKCGSSSECYLKPSTSVDIWSPVGPLHIAVVVSHQPLRIVLLSLSVTPLHRLKYHGNENYGDHNDKDGAIVL